MNTHVQLLTITCSHFTHSKGHSDRLTHSHPHIWTVSPILSHKHAQTFTHMSMITCSFAHMNMLTKHTLDRLICTYRYVHTL